MNDVNSLIFRLYMMINCLCIHKLPLLINHCDVRINDTIRPYKAKAYPKINIRIIPTKILSCWAFALTPASPTMPIAKPAD